VNIVRLVLSQHDKGKFTYYLEKTKEDKTIPTNIKLSQHKFVMLRNEA
jgi:hypothetical protein